MKTLLADIENVHNTYDTLIITVSIILVAGKIIDNYINGKNKNE